MTSLDALIDTPSESKLPRLAFRMHPRVLSTLGKDLVTNDIVAVIELVKNSYDALATRVDVGFGVDEKLGTYLEILDNGHGMSREILENVWCVVATPFRKLNPQAELGRRSRPVTGDKGLGRLSAARLGSQLEMITKAGNGPYLRVFLDWDELSGSDNLEASTFEISELGTDPGIGRHGTRLRVFGLNAEWTEDRLRELRENLARLVSPFSSQKDFGIFLTMPGEDSEPLEVEAPEFLSKPKSAIRGHATAAGDVSCKYEYHPIGEGRPRSRALKLTWEAVYNSLGDKSELDPKGARCGPFEFEIRAWDLTSEDTFEIEPAIRYREGEYPAVYRSTSGDFGISRRYSCASEIRGCARLARARSSQNQQGWHTPEHKPDRGLRTDHEEGESPDRGYKRSRATSLKCSSPGLPRDPQRTRGSSGEREGPGSQEAKR